jgi:hypothetical protein
MRAVLVWQAVLVVGAVLTTASCSDAPTAPEPSLTPEPGLADDDAVRLRWPWVMAPPSGPPVLVGAGDIAACDTRYQDEATAALLGGIDGTVFTAGDNAYPNGAPWDFRPCYDESWGKYKSRTRPSAGNHEYIWPAATAYFEYFGRSSNPPFGYYSYNMGSWHVVVLNSTPQVYTCYPPEAHEAEEEITWLPVWGTPPAPLPPGVEPSPAVGRACAGDVLQQLWLITDLLTHRRYKCTLAYFHHPRFSSGDHGNHYQVQKFWDILYAFGADVVVSGHDHLYERFAPQNPDGQADPVRGIVQFTVGTGGAPLYPFRETQPNSEVRQNSAHGVIKLSLHGTGYDWEFVPVANAPTVDPGTGHVIRDTGSGSCH